MKKTTRADRKLQRQLEAVCQEVCAVLKLNGFSRVNMAALLMLIGIPLADCEDMLDVWVELNDDAADQIIQDASPFIH